MKWHKIYLSGCPNLNLFLSEKKQKLQSFFSLSFLYYTLAKVRVLLLILILLVLLLLCKKCDSYYYYRYYCYHYTFTTTLAASVTTTASIMLSLLLLNTTSSVPCCYIYMMAHGRRPYPDRCTLLSHFTSEQLRDKGLARMLKGPAGVHEV